MNVDPRLVKPAADDSSRAPSPFSRWALMPGLFLSIYLWATPQAGHAQTKIKTKPQYPCTSYEYAQHDGQSLMLDLYQPDALAQRHPVVVFIHGGGWKNGSRKSAERLAAWLVEDGFAVAAIDYRLTDVAGWPAQIDDCYTAVRWLRANADRLQLDADRIAAWGGSAGGHLAALLGTRRFPGDESISSQVQAVCDWYGPSDLLTMPPNMVGNGRTAEDVAGSNGAKLLRATVRDVPELARDASALYQVSADDPPFLIMHGELDRGVPLDQSQRLHQALLAAGVDSRLEIVAGAGHGGREFRTDEVRQTVREFFQRTLTKAAPTQPPK